MFGWPSLSGMLAALGNYNEDCPADPGEVAQALGSRTVLRMGCCSRGAGSLLSSRCWLAAQALQLSIGSLVGAAELCKSQESHLAVLWTVGIFALNCGPVLMGFVLDYLGPKFTAILGERGSCFGPLGANVNVVAWRAEGAGVS